MSPNFCHAFGQFRILRNISGPSSVVFENLKMVLKKYLFDEKSYFKLFRRNRISRRSSREKHYQTVVIMNDSLRSTTQSSTAYKKNPLKPLLEDCRGVARRGFQVFRNLTFYNFRSRGTFYGIPLLKCRGMRYSLLENWKRKLIWKCITCYIEGYKRLQYKKMRINWTDHATLLLYTSLQYGILRLCLSRPFKRGTLVHTSKEKKEKKEEKYTLLTHHFKSGTGMTVSLPQCFTIN